MNICRLAQKILNGKGHTQNSFANSLILTTGTNLLLAVVGIFTGIIAARLLGPQGRGELAAIQNWPITLATFAMLGLSEAIVYFSARQPEKSSQYLLSAVILALLSSIPFMAIGFLALPTLLAAQSAAVISSARLYLLMVVLFALIGIPAQFLRGRGYLFAWNFLRLLPAFVWLTVLIMAFATKNVNPGWLAKINLFGMGLLSFLVIWIVFKRMSGPYRITVSNWKPLLQYGLPSMAGSVPSVLNLRLDQMLMAAFISPRFLGLYVVAVSWSGAMAPIFSAVGSILFPRVAATLSEEDQFDRFAQGVRLGVVIAAVFTVLLLFITPILIPLLYGDEYAPVIPTAVILIFAAAVAGINGILEEGARGLGDPKLVLFGESAGLLMTVCALAFLLKPYNIVGAAVASFLGYSVTMAALIFAIFRTRKYPLNRVLVPDYQDLKGIINRTKTYLNGLKNNQVG